MIHSLYLTGGKHIETPLCISQYNSIAKITMKLSQHLFKTLSTTHGRELRCGKLFQIGVPVSNKQVTYLVTVHFVMFDVTQSDTLSNANYSLIITLSLVMSFYIEEKNKAPLSNLSHPNTNHGS